MYKCTLCNHEFEKPMKITKGSIVIEIILWLCLLFPGVIYSLWRVTSRYKACPKCGWNHLMIL